MEGLKKYSLLTVLALVIGLLVGGIDTLFGRTLLWISAFRDQHFLYLVPFLALVGLVIVFLYQRFGGKAGQGMGLVFQVGHGEERGIPKRLIPLVIVTTWLTHLFGGSAGREGVAVQLGATIAHWFSRKIPWFDLSKTLLVTGMAAGFAGLFQTPLAATFFALEVLIVGELYLPALYPALVAALTASWTSHALGLEKFSQEVAVSLTWSPDLIWRLALLGLAFGVCGNTFAFTLAWLKKKVAYVLPNPYLRIAVLGVCLSLLLFVLGMGRYAGLGTNLISASFAGQSIQSYDWLLKLLLTALILAAGYQGGEVTPLFAMGASLGVILAGLVALPVALVAALGYAAVFGSATSTLLGPILIGGEVFGFANLPYFIIVCSIAFLLNPASSIYGAQKRKKF